MKKGHQPRKRFGQNFLRDPGIINRIVDAIAPTADQHLVEIGPGEGAITELLLESGCQFDAIELDRDLVPMLLARFDRKPNFSIHQADALRFDFSALYSGERPLRLVGNLPYNISTPLIFHLLEQADIIEDTHFMLQLEVVNRLAAQPGSKAWGKLGVMAQYHCEVSALFEVPPGAFTPAPKVQSAIVRLQPRNRPDSSPEQEARLRKVVTAASAQRRKAAKALRAAST